MTKIDVRHIQEWRDKKTGRIYRYTRSPPLPARVRLFAEPGTLEFTKEYSAVVNMARSPIKTTPGTMADLVRAYEKAKMTGLSPVTMKNYTNMMKKIGGEYGHLPVAKLERKHIREWVNKRAKEHPHSANHLLRFLRQLMQFAIVEGIRPDDPTLAIDKPTLPAGGFKDWGEDNIATYEATHSVGTQARLTLALMVYVDCRIGDVVNIGPRNFKPCTDPELKGLGVNFLLTYTQEKNRRRKPVTIEDLPVHPELERIIAASPIGKGTFIVSQRGKPFNKDALGKKMRLWCDAAGLPECSSHGLRKAALRRLAEAGATAHQLKAVGGHQTLAQVMHYTEEDDKKRGRREAMMKLLTVKP